MLAVAESAVLYTLKTSHKNLGKIDRSLTKGKKTEEQNHPKIKLSESISVKTKDKEVMAVAAFNLWRQCDFKFEGASNPHRLREQ